MTDWNRLLEKDHPVWKLAQGLVSIGLVLVLVTHGLDGAHQGGLDGTDIAGAGGAALGARLVWAWIRG